MKAACLAILLLLSAPARGDQVSELLTQVDQARKDLRTFQAEFVQKNRVRLFRQEMRSSGRLAYEGGASEEGTRLRWEYVAPDPSVVIMVGRDVHLRLPGQAARRFRLDGDGALAAIFDELQRWLGSRPLSSAREQYTLSVQGKPGAQSLVMVPKQGSPLAKTFSRIEMRVDRRTGLLSGLLLVEQNGDEKEIAFGKVQKNAPVPRGTFEVK